ncbi:MAG: hypothetical protein HOE97_02145 [Rhodospirillaceae bacterium]|nr:hypothetical protein [Rhodospirillaceae bacterium]
MLRLLDKDIITALVLFGIGGFFLNAAGDDVKNWIFPVLAIYLLMGIAAALVLRVAFQAFMKRAPDIVRLAREDRVIHIDVLVFFLIVLAFMFVMSGIGFWLASFLMLTLTSNYLTLDKSRQNIRLAIVVPLGVCILFYVVFLHVFYVPFPKATWWPGLT